MLLSWKCATDTSTHVWSLIIDVYTPCPIHPASRQHLWFDVYTCIQFNIWVDRKSFILFPSRRNFTTISRQSTVHSFPCYDQENLGPSTLLLGHAEYWIITSEPGRVIFFLNWRPVCGWNLRSPTFQAGSFNHFTGASAPHVEYVNNLPLWAQ